jgi:hypothetical protein
MQFLFFTLLCSAQVPIIAYDPLPLVSVFLFLLLLALLHLSFPDLVFPFPTLLCV